MEFLGKDNAWVYCSEEEGLDRERMLDVHVLEATDETKALAPSKRLIDPSKAVRKFIRSGGDNLHQKLPPRSIEALRATASYLSQLWIEAPDGVHYAFVMDRMNAIRQELVSRESTIESLRLLLHLARLYIFMDKCCHEIVAMRVNYGGWYDPHMHTSSEVSCVTAALGAVANIGSTAEVEKARDELTSYHTILLALSAFRRAMDTVLNEGVPGLRAMLDARIRFPWLQDGQCLSGKPSGEGTIIAHRFVGEVLVQGNPHKGLGYCQQQEASLVGLTALFYLFTADLAVWRFLLIESTANKNEGLRVGDLARRCGLAGSSGVKCMVGALSALGCSPSEESEGSSGSAEEAVYVVRGSGRVITPEAIRATRSLFSHHFARESMSNTTTAALWIERLVE